MSKEGLGPEFITMETLAKKKRNGLKKKKRTKKRK